MALSGRIEELVKQPRESLAVEVKDWLDLSTPSHQAKVIKALFALRNFNGGYLVIGFDKATMQPSKNLPAKDPVDEYSADAIQALISKYASEPFEVNVEFPEREGIRHPVLTVPGGPRSPIVAKTDLRDGQTVLIARDDVYIRSLSSNNIASSTKARWQDWPNIVQICFDNREADIGNFLRRHLGAGAREQLLEVVADSLPQSHRARVEDFYRESAQRAAEVLGSRKSIPPHGYWESVLVLNGEVPPQRLNLDFLRKLDAVNPRYTGWPVWLNPETFKDESTHPYVYAGKLYEAAIVNAVKGWGAHIDFMRLDPSGRFYLRRAYEDDLLPEGKPSTTLDFSLPILRVGETIAVGLAFAKGMGCNPEKTSLSFMFVWNNLRGRTMSSWADLRRMFWAGRPGDRERADSYIEVPLDMPLSRIGSVTKEVTNPLFDAFDANIDTSVIEDLTARLVERRL